MEQPFVTEHSITSPDLPTNGALALDKFYLEGRGSKAFWSEVFAQMAGSLMEITSEVAPNMDRGDISQKLQEIYRFQPLLGLSAALERSHMVPFIEKTVKINGKDCLGVSDIVQYFDEILVREGILEPVPYTRIHGKLSLDKMEFDIDARKLKLLGRVRSRPFGDLRQDLAKLHFSLEGGIDYLKLKTNGIEGLKLEFLSGYPFDEVQDMYKDWLNVLNPDLVRQIPLIVALDCLVKLQDSDTSPFEQQALLARSIYTLTPYVEAAKGLIHSHVA